MIGVFAVSALIGILSLIFYREGDTASRFAFAVLLLYTVASPLGELISGIGDGEYFGSLEFSPEEYGEEYKEVAKDAFCEGVKKMVCDEFSLSKENVEVRVFNFDFSSMRAERIKVILKSGASFADYKGIEKFVNQYGFGECDAEIEIG